MLRFRRKAQLDQFLVGLADFGQQRAGGHAHDRVFGDLPAQLLHDLVAHALGTFRVVGAHIDVHKGPAEFSGDLRAQPVHLVVMPFDADDLRAVHQRIHDLALLQIARNENIRAQTRRRRVGGHRVGQVSGGSAGHRGKAKLPRPAQRHADHAVLE